MLRHFYLVFNLTMVFFLAVPVAPPALAKQAGISDSIANAVEPELIPLISPANGAILSSPPAALNWGAWSSGSLPITYTVLLGSNPDFASPGGMPSIGSTSDTSFPLGLLLPGNTYHWQVIATDADGATAESNIGVFTYTLTPCAQTGDLIISLQAGIQEAPHLAYHSDTHLYLATFLQPSPNNAQQRNIFGQYLNDQGGMIGSAFLIAQNLDSAENRVIAGGGAFLVVWRSGEDIHGAALQGRWVDASNLHQQVLGGTFVVTDGDLIDQGFSAVYNPFMDKFLVAWTSFDLDGVYGRYLTAGSTPQEPQVRIADKPAGFALSLAINPDDQNYLLAYHIWTGPQYQEEIYSQLVTDSLAASGSQQQLTSFLPGIQWFPTVAYSSQSHEYLVFWYDERSQQTELYGQRVSANGLPTGGNIPLVTGAAARGWQTIVGLSSGPASYLALWQELLPGQAHTLAHGLYLDSSGTALGTAFNLSTRTDSQQLTPTGIGASAGDLAVWQDDSAFGSRILGQRIFAGACPAAQDNDSVSGRVLAPGSFDDESASPVKGAYVQACSDTNICQVTATKTDGSYAIASLDDGTYSLKALPPADSSLLPGELTNVGLAGGSELSNQDIVLAQANGLPPGVTITNRGTNPDGTPVIYWQDTLTLTTANCAANLGAYYRITQNGIVIAQGRMTGNPPRASIPPLAPSHGYAQVEIMCGDIPPTTQINCNLSSTSSVRFSSFPTTAERMLVCNAVRSMAGQLGGDANFLNLAQLAANHANSPGVTQVDYQYSTTEGAHWVPETGIVYMPDGLVSSSSETVEEARDVTRSYLPTDWRASVSTYQNVTIFHESIHMLQAARPDIITQFEAIYDDDTDSFLYPNGTVDCRSMTGRATYEVEAQIMALVIEYGVLNNLSVTDLTTAQMDQIATTLSQGAQCGRSVRPQLVYKVQEILRSLQPTDFNIYIDPSGHVRTTNGNPLAGATVTLYSAGRPEGIFNIVADGSALMSPANRRNPDTTDAQGHFGWDVLAGYYKVRAEKAGCHSPLDPTLDYVESAILTIPPPVTDLDLRLDCGESFPTTTPQPTLEPTVTPTPTASITPTQSPTPTATLTPTRTATPTVAGYPATILGLKALLKDLKQQGKVDNEFYKPMDKLLSQADTLRRNGHKEAAIVVLIVFSRVTQVQSGNHITVGAAQQLLDLTHKVIRGLR